MKLKSQRSCRVCATRERKIKHQIFEGKTVWIIINQRRFFFSKYDKRLWEKLPNVSVKKQTSNTYIINTIKSLNKTTYSHNAELRQSSPMFSSRLIDALPEIKINWTNTISQVGLDGKNIGKHKQSFTLTNLDQKELISALPPMNQKELIHTLNTVELSLRLNVNEVCIDMDKFMKSVAVKCFPKS